MILDIKVCHKNVLSNVTGMPHFLGKYFKV
jgi:hypothetical protein